MTRNEAYNELGLEPGATQDAIKAAFRARAKATHSDLNGGGREADAQFHRVHEAYETLISGDTGDDFDGREAAREAHQGKDQGRSAPPNDAAVDFVQTFLAGRGIEILFDGTLHKAGAPLRACSREGIRTFLNIEDINLTWLIDELVGETRIRGIKFSKSDLTRAVRVVMRKAMLVRRNAIMEPLLDLLTDVEQEAAATAWSQLTNAVFETDPALATACLKHFIWQAKRKVCNEIVENHLMPVIWSPTQGGGNTTFIRVFLGPLHELAAPALLSDFVDKRSGDIYRYPVLFVDDMEQIDTRQIQPLKSLISGDTMRRRKLGTSLTEGYQQRTTLIGTANHTIHALVADTTGSRRFAGLLFRNGKVETGGDRSVWDAVAAADYDLLWRSVDVYGPAPIAAHMPALVALQKASRPPDPMLTWLLELDLQSERVKQVLDGYGARASDLWELYCEQMNSMTTNTMFGIGMTLHVTNQNVPFGPRIKKQSGWHYPVKIVAADPADPADPADARGADAPSSADLEGVM
jgi:hypothetical protein